MHNKKGFGSADCDTINTIYLSHCTVHNQLIRTIFGGGLVLDYDCVVPGAPEAGTLEDCLKLLRFGGSVFGF